MGGATKKKASDSKRPGGYTAIVGLLDSRLTEVSPKWKNAGHMPLAMVIHWVLLGLTIR